MPRRIKPVHIEGDVAYVPLSRGYEAIVDALDAPDVGRFNWSVLSPKRPYAARTLYGPGSTKMETVYMHRHVMDAPKGAQVDHINGNRLDNRRSNLRICSAQENRFNQPAHKDNATGLKGVHRDRGWYRATIMKDGIAHRLGQYETPEEAAEAYNAAARQLFGDFAYHQER